MKLYLLIVNLFIGEQTNCFDESLCFITSTTSSVVYELTLYAYDFIFINLNLVSSTMLFKIVFINWWIILVNDINSFNIAILFLEIEILLLEIEILLLLLLLHITQIWMPVLRRKWWATLIGYQTISLSFNRFGCRFLCIACNLITFIHIIYVNMPSPMCSSSCHGKNLALLKHQMT